MRCLARDGRSGVAHMATTMRYLRYRKPCSPSPAQCRMGGCWCHESRLRRCSWQGRMPIFKRKKNAVLSYPARITSSYAGKTACGLVGIARHMYIEPCSPPPRSQESRHDVDAETSARLAPSPSESLRTF